MFETTVMYALYAWGHYVTKRGSIGPCEADDVRLFEEYGDADAAADEMGPGIKVISVLVHGDPEDPSDVERYSMDVDAAEIDAIERDDLLTLLEQVLPDLAIGTHHEQVATILRQAGRIA